MRQFNQQGREAIATSAINGPSLQPLLERAGAILARDLVGVASENPDEHDVVTLSRIA
jgi:hypothetical protein